MVTRIPALKKLAKCTGETLVTWEHYARMMNKAPGRYSTVLGRGHRHSHCSAEWLISTFLAGVIGDPKNSATKVPLCGDLYRQSILHHSRSISNGENIGDKIKPNDKYINRRMRTHKRGEGHKTLGAFTGAENLTLFDLIVKIIKDASGYSSDLTCELTREGLEITIAFGKSISAEVTCMVEASEEYECWTTLCYWSDSPQDEVSIIPIERRSVISCEHMGMLVGLYSDTLKYEAATKVNPGPTSSTAPSLMSVSESECNGVKPRPVWKA